MSFTDDMKEKHEKFVGKKRVEELEDIATINKRTSDEFTKFFGQEPDSIAGDFAWKDKFVFRYNRYNDDWALQGKCSECGEMIFSYSTCLLSGILAYMFGKFETYNHQCFSKRESQPTTEEKLIKLLRKFVYENQQQEEN